MDLSPKTLHETNLVLTSSVDPEINLSPNSGISNLSKNKSVWGNITLFAAWVAYFGSALRGGNVIVRYEKGQPRNVIHPPIR